MRRAIAIAVLVAVGLPGGTAGDAQAAAAHLEKGDADAARAALAGGDVDRDDPAVQYHLGMLARQDGAAKKHFRAVLAHGPSVYADDAQFQLAESAYADPMGLYVTARKAFQKLVDTYPESPHVPLALYRIGRTYLITAESARGALKQARTDSAHAAFQAAADGYPTTEAGQLARLALLGPDAAARGMTEVQAEPDRTPPTAAGSGRYRVQVGAFSDRSLVTDLVSRLEANGLLVRLVASGAVTRVQVGPYETRERAERASRHIALTEGVECRVIEE